MAKFLIIAIFAILPAVFASPPAENEPRSVPVGVASAVGVGANYGQQSAASETHDKKNFGVNFSSDKGSSNQYSNANLQAAASGAVAPSYPYPTYQYNYPSYPYYPAYPYAQYPQYPVYPNYAVPNVGWGSPAVPYGVQNVGVPNVGATAGVQVPNVSAGAGVGAVQGVGQVPVRY